MGDLFEAVGGAPAVAAVVDELYVRLSVDPTVGHHFEPERLESLKARQRAWFEAALRGSVELPSDLAAAHAGLEIDDRQVEVVIGHLDDILAEVAVAPRLRRAVVGMVSRQWYARNF